jgi:hypothetical protein
MKRPFHMPDQGTPLFASFGRILEAAYETEARRRLFGASCLLGVVLSLAGLSDVAD